MKLVDEDEIELSVKEPGDFLIKMDDSEGMGDEPMDMDVSDMEPMGDMDDMDMDDEIDVDDEDMDDEEEVMYEIALGEDGEYPMDYGDCGDEEVLDESGEEDLEEMDSLEEKISQNAVDERRSGGKLTSTKASGAKKQAKFLGHKVNESKIIKKYNVLLKEAKQLKNKNEEYKGALRKFRTMLAETVVFNSNLTYVTKLFMEHSTTKQEKENVFKRFDSEVSTLKESKQLYKRIASEFGSRKPINESISKKMNKEVNTGVSKQLNESTAYVDKETSRIIGLMKRVDKR
jgi:hypothetical protein